MDKSHKLKWLSMRWVMILALAILVAGCGSGSKSSTDGDELPITDTDLDDDGLSIEEPPEPLEPVLPFRHILTGIGSEEEVLSRPAAIMVENQLHARPQSGLHLADIVYEILAEGDITRFVAIYQSHSPELIGPIRSIRPYYIELGAALDALIIHAGWSPAAKTMLTKETNLPWINEVSGGDHVYFWRSKERVAPHNVYSSMEHIRKGQQDKKYREEWTPISLSFYEENEAIAGESAEHVIVKYIGKYEVAYEYDEAFGTYKRFMEGEAHADKETGEQLTASNILIARTSHKILDSVGRRAVDVKGPGEGYLVQGGKVREITWQLKDGLIRAYIDDEEQKLVPGTTWIQVIPTSSEVKFE